MLRLALRSARAHWRRFVLTATAVVVGVAFVVAGRLAPQLARDMETTLGPGMSVEAERCDEVPRLAGGKVRMVVALR